MKCGHNTTHTFNMELTFTVLAAAIILLLAIYIRQSQMSFRKMPPGPFVVPILGSALSIWLRNPILNPMKAQPWKYFDGLAKEFGDIFSFRFANTDFVVITSHEILEEVANMDEYSCKFAHELLTYGRTFGRELGLIFAWTPALWMEMRKFTVRTLREFGFGKAYTMHSVITDEATQLIHGFKSRLKDGQGVIKIHNTFSLSVINVLWCMVAGIRYDHTDPELNRLLDRIFKQSKTATLSNPIELLVPFIIKIFPGFCKFRYDVLDEMHEFSREIMDKRIVDGVYMTNPQNYIDCFLNKIDNCQNNEKMRQLYTKQQLQSMLADLLLVGSLTLNATLSYAMLFLTIYPEVQQKCQAEIDTVVSRSFNPTVDDIAKMPYFQAFILEVHRCASVVPNPIPRLIPNDWHFRGYIIPKGAVVLSNHYSINNDNKIWGDADVFRPERFINTEGIFEPDPRVVIFGFGKRICIGIHLVNAIVPLFISLLLQNFSFTVVPGTETPTTEPEVGVSLSPLPFSVQIKIRGESTN